MELLLVRHGEAARNSLENYNAALNCPDPELTEAGREHARLLGVHLSETAVQCIYASDLKRAIQTAQILAKSAVAEYAVAEFSPVPLYVRPELREINMGRLFLSTWEEVERDLPGYAARWHRHDSDLPYPDGECGADVIHRCLPLIDEIVQSGVERAVIVTHGGTIRCLLCAFLGIGPEKRFLFGAPLANCGLTSVRWDRKQRTFLIHSVNETGYYERIPKLPGRLFRSGRGLGL